MNTKEKWIEETMESLEGITRAQSSPLLYDRVISGLRNSQKRIIFFKPKNLWRIAAGLALLISFNVFSVHYYTKSHKEDHSQINALASEYFSYIETIKL